VAWSERENGGQVRVDEGRRIAVASKGHSYCHKLAKSIGVCDYHSRCPYWIVGRDGVVRMGQSWQNRLQADERVGNVLPVDECGESGKVDRGAEARENAAVRGQIDAD
jgi:hypothetical protein